MISTRATKETLIIEQIRNCEQYDFITKQSHPTIEILLINTSAICSVAKPVCLFSPAVINYKVINILITIDF